MTERRINPETGVFEQHDGSVWDLLFGEQWESVYSESGAETRVNPDTGEIEEHTPSFLDLLFGKTWTSVE